MVVLIILVLGRLNKFIIDCELLFMRVLLLDEVELESGDKVELLVIGRVYFSSS